MRSCLFAFYRQAKGVEDIPLVEGTLQHLLASAQIHIVHPAAVQFLEGNLMHSIDGLHNPHELVGLIQCHTCILHLMF